MVVLVSSLLPSPPISAAAVLSMCVINHSFSSYSFPLSQVCIAYPAPFPTRLSPPQHSPPSPRPSHARPASSGPNHTVGIVYSEARSKQQRNNNTMNVYSALQTSEPRGKIMFSFSSSSCFSPSFYHRTYPYVSIPLCLSLTPYSLSIPATSTVLPRPAFSYAPITPQSQGKEILVTMV
ncbi:hypothetical protein E2C01_040308 [Portunus trituberculatus]|uniref:Uncharacterized protein n=1 Tax=Portunus trituberculatus TaxID=210409 RepID=A0A5B7FMN2_PORTR|nr:hypothetical protein [Portunus trituberculatus]